MPSSTVIGDDRRQRVRFWPSRSAGLAKHYGRLVAVSDLTLEVRAGEVFGFLGLERRRQDHDHPRPARPAASDRRPRLDFGHDCQADGLAVRAGLGYLPGELGFYTDMTGEETLQLLLLL